MNTNTDAGSEHSFLNTEPQVSSRSKSDWSDKDVRAHEWGKNAQLDQNELEGKKAN